MVQSIADIQDAILNLSPKDRSQLIEWLELQQEKTWDEQIGRDFDEGKLNAVIDRVRLEEKQGKLRPGP